LTWAGRRDHTLILMALQTGIRLSEMIALKRDDLILRTGAHVRLFGKGRKERCTPLAKRTVAVLREWLKEPVRGTEGLLFTNSRGSRLSPDGIQYIVTKYALAASVTCPSLASKRVSPHVFRHTAAMELLLAGLDRTVIAMWLVMGQSNPPQIYLDANLAMKEQALAKVQPLGARLRRDKPDDALLSFLKDL